LVCLGRVVPVFELTPFSRLSLRQCAMRRRPLRPQDSADLFECSSTCPPPRGLFMPVVPFFRPSCAPNRGGLFPLGNGKNFPFHLSLEFFRLVSRAPFSTACRIPSSLTSMTPAVICLGRVKGPFPFLQDDRIPVCRAILAQALVFLTSDV